MRFLFFIVGLFLAASPFAQTAPRLPPAPQLRIAGSAESPVSLCAAAIEADIVAGEAVTQIEMRFCNSNNRVLEGELQFPLLPGQQVIGLALDVEGKMRDAVPVEKARGREVFEDIARRGADPALLEATAENQYRLRVYPVPARGERRVRLRYAEALTSRAGAFIYRLPLVFAEPLESLDLRLTSFAAQAPKVSGVPLPGARLERKGEIYEYRVEGRNVRSQSMLELKIPATEAPVLATEDRSDGRYFSASVFLPTAARFALSRKLPKTVALFWDASGSSRHFDRERIETLLDAYFRALGDARVTLMRVRDAIEAGERFEVHGGDWSKLREAIRRTPADGGSSLGAIADLPGADEQLIVSDGLSNFGSARVEPLERPSYAIAAGVGANLALLRHLTEASGGGVIDLLASNDREAARLLLERQPRLLRLEGAELWVAATRSPRDGRWQIAGRMTSNAALRAIVLDARGREHRIDLAAAAGAPPSRLAGLQWARLRIAEMEAEPLLHRAEIRRLGEAFGLPTRETSLIVLERLQDYVRYDIAPPPELRQEFDRLRAEQGVQRERTRHEHGERVVKLFEAKVAWWERDFPQDEKPRIALAKNKGMAEGGATLDERRVAESSSMPPPRAMSPAAAPMAPAPAQKSESGRSGSSRNGEQRAEASISLRAWTPDAPYIGRLRNARKEDLYRVYMDERPSWEKSTAFFLDAAERFFELGQNDIALRVLSNLAELEVENRAILRILAYRLMQAGRAELAVPLFERVRLLAPDEPQSHRDLALGLWAAGDYQKAVDSFAEVIDRSWDARFPEIELIAVAELNALLATTGQALDTRRVDPRLLRNLPLDLRAVLTWDADNTDIDLWVTDPNGERCFFGNRLSYQGGRMSSDFTQGYGPEEFSLRRAKPGKYRIEVKFYGHRQQVVSSTTALAVRLQTGFGTRNVKERTMSLRLDRAGDGVFVGEFEVPAH